MSDNRRTERACPDCGKVVLMLTRQERCPECAAVRKRELSKQRHHERYVPKAPSERVCAGCGKTFVTTGYHKYCPECSTPEARDARNRAIVRVKKPRELKCMDCGAVFMGLHGKKYCPECSTPEAVAARRAKMHDRWRGKRVAEIIEDMRDGESPQARKARKKYEKLIADLISGAREPKTNHEAIVKMEALGRIHGGVSGSYGKEAAGYYEKE